VVKGGGWRGVTALVALVAGVAVLVASASGQDTDDAGKPEAEAPVEFTDAFLNDPENVALGKQIWSEQCTHCHGAKAYPGKAPRLRPRRYTPDFVYGRVTKGFRGMPPWEDVYDQHQRMAVVAYVLSRHFSP
jgi:mono/diheme cytochrome c family protein